MNIKTLKKLGLGLVCLFALAACQSEQAALQEKPVVEETENSNKQEEKIEFTLIDGEKEISRKELNFETGDKLGDIMEKNMEVVKDDSGFITEIDGISQNPEENKYWTYTANGEMVNVGAYDYELKPGDQIVFTLSVYDGQ